jgi:site-specific DNA recombinase
MKSRNANGLKQPAPRNAKSLMKKVTTRIAPATLIACLRVAIYARYSSNLQNPISTARQVSMCLAKIKATPSWRSVATYRDEEISGEKLMKRPGIQALLQAVKSRQVDVVLAEALDRVSRDPEHTAGIYKKLQGAGVELWTLQDGKITRMHVAMRSLQNAEHQDALRERVRESTRLHVTEGTIVGLAYGYDMDRSESGRDGMPVRGRRKTNKREAKVVKRIFIEYAKGVSPRAIAAALNADGIPSPRAVLWVASTINGDKRRNSGILNNEMYIGRFSYGMTQKSMDPDTENTITTIKPKEQRVACEHPELRIIDQDLWNAVKARQASTAYKMQKNRGQVRPEEARRPKYLLSGIVRCGACGGTYVVGSHTTMRCGRMYESGGSACDNVIRANREDLEAAVLNGLQTHLMQPTLVRAFVRDFRKELSRASREADADKLHIKVELSKIQREIRNVVAAIKEGIRTPTISSELRMLEARQEQLVELAQKPSGRSVAVPANLATIYHSKVENLRQELNRGSVRAEAADALRAIIKVVRLTPKNGHLDVSVELHIPAVVGLAANDNGKRPDLSVITVERVRPVQ